MIIKIESVEHFAAIAMQHSTIKNTAFQAIDLTQHEDILFEKSFENCLFLGCNMSIEAQKKLIETDNLFFPKMDLPFQVYRNKLYGHTELYNGFSYTDHSTYTNTKDYLIYQYYESKVK